MSDQYMNGMKTQHLSFELNSHHCQLTTFICHRVVKKEKNKLLGMSKKYKNKG